MKSGDRVLLVNTDIPRLEGQEAEVVEVTAWGAHVATSAAATGRFRAHHSEMMAVRQVYRAAHLGPPKMLGGAFGTCDVCGGSRMTRNGNCLLCQECGSTSGCS